MMCGHWECRRGQDCACPLWGHHVLQDHNPGSFHAQPVTPLVGTNTDTCCTQSKTTGKMTPCLMGDYFFEEYKIFSAFICIYLFIFHTYLFGKSEKENPDQGFKLSLRSLTWDLISRAMRSWPEPNSTRKLKRLSHLGACPHYLNL